MLGIKREKKPKPSDLEDAEPLPFFYDHTWDPTDENLALVIENDTTYKPCLPRGSRGRMLENPIVVAEDKIYVAVHEYNGKKYLIDGPTYIILYEIAKSRCNLTVADIVQLLMREAARDNEMLREIAEKGEGASEDAKEVGKTFIALVWRQLAMLRDKGILI